MALTSEQKKEILLQSFEILKDDIEGNDSKLAEIIEKMIGIDLDVAIEMWKFILDNDKILDWSTTGKVIDSFKEQIGAINIANIVYENSLIRKKVFREASDIDIGTEIIIECFVKLNELEFVNELLSDIFSNRNKNRSFPDYLEKIINRCREIGKGAVELFINWNEKIKDESKRARINVSLLEYM